MADKTEYPTSLLDALAKGKASISPTHLETIPPDDPSLRQLAPQEEVDPKSSGLEQRLSYLDRTAPSPSATTEKSETNQEPSTYIEAPWVQAARSGTLAPAINGGSPRDNSKK